MSAATKKQPFNVWRIKSKAARFAIAAAAIPVAVALLIVIAIAVAWEGIKAAARAVAYDAAVYWDSWIKEVLVSYWLLLSFQEDNRT